MLFMKEITGNSFNCCIIMYVLNINFDITVNLHSLGLASTRMVTIVLLSTSLTLYANLLKQIFNSYVLLTSFIRRSCGDSNLLSNRAELELCMCSARLYYLAKIYILSLFLFI